MTFRITTFVAAVALATAAIPSARPQGRGRVVPTALCQPQAISASCSPLTTDAEMGTGKVFENKRYAVSWSITDRDCTPQGLKTDAFTATLGAQSDPGVEISNVSASGCIVTFQCQSSSWESTSAYVVIDDLDSYGCEDDEPVVLLVAQASPGRGVAGPGAQPVFANITVNDLDYATAYTRIPVSDGQDIHVRCDYTDTDSWTYYSADGARHTDTLYTNSDAAAYFTDPDVADEGCFMSPVTNATSQILYDAGAWLHCQGWRPSSIAVSDAAYEPNLPDPYVGTVMDYGHNTCDLLFKIHAHLPSPLSPFSVEVEDGGLGEVDPMQFEPAWLLRSFLPEEDGQTCYQHLQFRMHKIFYDQQSDEMSGWFSWDCETDDWNMTYFSYDWNFTAPEDYAIPAGNVQIVDADYLLWFPHFFEETPEIGDIVVHNEWTPLYPMVIDETRYDYTWGIGYNLRAFCDECNAVHGDDFPGAHLFRFHGYFYDWLNGGTMLDVWSMVEGTTLQKWYQWTPW